MKRGLPTPVRRIVEDALDEDAISRGFRGVAERRAVGAGARLQRPWRMATRFVVLAALATLAAVLLWGPGLWNPEAGRTTVEGQPFLVLENTERAGDTAQVALDDGSSFEVSDGGRLVAVDNTERRFVGVLERGRARVHVNPGSSRSWIFECGPLSAEVVGTRFSLQRTATLARVDVEEGVVLVRGEGVPNRVRRLGAGEWVEVSLAEGTAEGSGEGSEAPALAPAPSAAELPAARPSASVVSSAAAPPSDWRALAGRGAYDEAYRALGPRGVQGHAAERGVEDLFLLADVARRSGHPSEAVAPLERIVAEHGGDARAALAAFTLASLRMDALGRPGQAALDYERALAMGLPGALQEDAMARVAEARQRAGDREGARRAAQRYLATFPSGRHVGSLRGIVDEQ